MDSKTLTERLARRLDIPKADVADLIESFASVLAERGSELDSLAIPGFGMFEPKKRNERVAMVPGTDRRLLLPPKITLSFRPSALLKQKMKQS